MRVSDITSLFGKFVVLFKETLAPNLIVKLITAWIKSTKTFHWYQMYRSTSVCVSYKYLLFIVTVTLLTMHAIYHHAFECFQILHLVFPPMHNKCIMVSVTYFIDSSHLDEQELILSIGGGWVTYCNIILNNKHYEFIDW